MASTSFGYTSIAAIGFVFAIQLAGSCENLLRDSGADAPSAPDAYIRRFESQRKADDIFIGGSKRIPVNPVRLARNSALVTRDPEVGPVPLPAWQHGGSWITPHFVSQKPRRLRSTKKLLEKESS